jgi:ferredoxin
MKTMAYVVTGPCDNCKYTDCVEVCPVDAFREGATMLYIDPEACIDCGACIPECPVEAIFDQDEIPDNQKQYIKINEEMSKNLPPITQRKDPLPTAKPRR